MERILVVFDMDGVLVDTLPMLEAVYRKFLEGYGKTGSSQEFSRLNGYTIGELTDYLKRVHELKEDRQVLLEKYVSLISECMGEARLSCGAAETLSCLKKKGCIVGIGSSAGREYISAMLRRYEIEDYIDFVVSGEDVRHAKPSTEIYENARRKCPFDRCYVVEDSDNGIRAAQTQDPRCAVVFYQGTQQYSMENYQYRIDDLRQLCRILEQPQKFRSFLPVNAVAFEVSEENGQSSCFNENEAASGNGYDAETVWQQEKEKNPGLFNGKIFCLRDVETEAGGKALLKVSSSEYKYYKWAMYKRNQGMYQEIMPAAVSAVLLDEEGNTLLSRRKNVTQYRERYELVPSGSLDYAEDLTQEQVFAQIREELFQELAGSIGQQDILSMRILGISCDIPEQVLDICAAVFIKGNLKAFSISGNEEYDRSAFMTLPLQELPDRTDLHSGLVPTSLEIIKYMTANAKKKRMLF